MTETRLPLSNSADLRAAIAAADIPTLLMTYAHLARDAAMLDRFAPHIHAVTSGKITAIPDDLRDLLQEKMLAVLTTPGAAETDVPNPKLLRRIMSVGMGEPVDDAFIPLLLEQSGLGPQPDRTHRAARELIPAAYKVVVIGAGITGLVAGIKLAEAGYSYEIIEKNQEVGGTWWVARYPGAGVDTPSHFYSYSFELNPDWTTYTPKGPEMQDYLVRASEKYGVREHIRFGTEVLRLQWLEADQQWEIETRDFAGTITRRRANAVINAHGRLSRWEWPAIEGVADFAGDMVHTAAWDPSLDLTGKRVALVGTGASASQFGPAIVDQVEHLTVFMRSGHWVVPPSRSGEPVAPGVRWAMRHIPRYLEWFRFGVYWTGSDGLYSNLLKDPTWPPDGASVSPVNERLRQYCLANMRTKLATRPDLLEKLTPDCPVFSKRIVMDAGWLTMFLKDNVTLETSGIERILPHAIRTSDGVEHPADVLVFATGYNVAKMAGALEIVGQNGRNLGAEWGEEDPVAYLGMMVPGFPNYFHTLGPNSAPNHGAGVNLVAETQVNYIIECLDHMMETGTQAISPTREAFEAFDARVQGQMPAMIWTHPKANSYYKNTKGRVIGSWPFRLLDYWTETRRPIPDHFVFHPSLSERQPEDANSPHAGAYTS